MHVISFALLYLNNKYIVTYLVNEKTIFNNLKFKKKYRNVTENYALKIPEDYSIEYLKKMCVYQLANGVYSLITNTFI